MSVVCLLQGSNLGDRYAQMERAGDMLCRTIGKKLAASGYYRSPRGVLQAGMIFLTVPCCLKPYYLHMKYYSVALKQKGNWVD